MSETPLQRALRSLPSGRPPEGAKERSWVRLAAAQPVRERRLTRSVPLVAAIVLAAVLLAATLAARRGPMPRASAPVRIAWADAERDAPLRFGETLETADREALVGDGATFLAWVSPGAHARIERRGQGLVLRLGRGEVRVWSASRALDRALEVVTARHRVRVVGTLFTVRTGPRGDAVWVGNGVVEVRGGGAVARLVPGARWASGEEAPATLAAEEIEWLQDRATAGGAGLRGGWSHLQRSDGPTPGAPTKRTLASAPPAPAAPAPVVSFVSPRPTPSTGSDPQPEPEPEPEPEPRAPSSEPEPRDPSSDREPRDPSPDPDPESESGTAPEPRVASERDEARHAMELERQGRVPEALARYRQIARDGGPAAEFALYRAGRLQMRRQRDLAGALATFRDARQRFPAGGLRQEIDLSILDALVRAGRRAEAAAEATAFLRRWPQSERRAEVDAIRVRLAGEQEVER